LARTSLEPLLQLHRIVSSIEDEQRSGPLLLLLVLMREAHKRSHLLGGYLVGVPRGVDASHVHGGGPTLADEVELCDELVGPSGDDGLPGGVAGRMVVETSLGATLCVAAIPHANVYGIDWGFASSKRKASEHSAQSLGIDSSTAERIVEAAPATAVRRLQAQVNWRRDCLCGEKGVGEFEECVSAAMEAVVE
jgi:hypothetical protein